MGAKYQLLYQVLVNVIPTGTFCKLRRHYDLLTFSLKHKTRQVLKCENLKALFFHGQEENLLFS